ncbi:hypothetical protein C4571_02930 [Candidatus Parcubacteria bacterium]|nr:MAG: hypothetical protein C4571_02930 [Candidatus Parcubacteria bacterium]
MKIIPFKTRIFREGEDLFTFITERTTRIRESSVLVVTSKIVALSERRTAEIRNEKTRERLIKAESDWAMRAGDIWLTSKNGAMMSSAGIDESNARGKVILLPKDGFGSARALWRKLKRHYGVRRLGVLITDSRRIPFRRGIFAVAVGYAGFRGLRDSRGKPDIFGRKLKAAVTNVADSLATAAVLLMGEGREQRPLALIQNAPVEFTDGPLSSQELVVEPRDDLYGHLFKKRRGASRR